MRRLQKGVRAMTAHEMTELLASLTGPIFEPVKWRIQQAGVSGFSWVWRNVSTLVSQGFEPAQIDGMARASALVACELQVIVEAFHAEKAGGVLILPKGQSNARD